MKTKKEVITGLEEVLNKHRNKAFVTCEDTCFCWEIERYLMVDCADEVEHEEYLHCHVFIGGKCECGAVVNGKTITIP